jgi:glycolate oxidase iron-sulfur subunit
VARGLASQTLEVFGRNPVDAVVVNAAGCGSNMKEYQLQLRGDPASGVAAGDFSRSVRDAGEFLTQLGLRPPPRTLTLRVTYQDACHLAHGQKITREPRQLLNAIPGIELVEMEESDWCCGSAGVYNLTHPEIAEQALKQKLQRIHATGAQVVVSCNPGCIMQLAMGLQREGMDVPVVHLMDLLGWAYGDSGAAPAIIDRALAAGAGFRGS